MSYDRDETVAAVTSFYKFLVNTHIPDSALRIPPEGGWPELTDEFLSFTEKDATARDLIRHLPYIRADKDGSWQVYPRSEPIDFTRKELNENPDLADYEPHLLLGVKAGESAITLSSKCSRSGHHIFLDTKRGTATLADLMIPLPKTELSQNTPPSEDEYGYDESWREEETYMIPDFFEKLKAEYQNFEMFANNDREINLGSHLSEEKLESVKEIYRSYGWLTENYRKEECLKAVEQAIL